MKLTLLDLVQVIASSMDSDEVNSINDSVESLQIALLVRSAYYDIIGRANLPEHYSLVNLDPAPSPVTTPNLMYVPSRIAEIQWVQYNKFTNPATEVASHGVNQDIITTPQDEAAVIQMVQIDYLPLQNFLLRMNALDPNNPNVFDYDLVIGPDIFKIFYMNDQSPNFYTTFDDRTIVFDSFDASFESAMQSSNSLCYGRLVIPFTLSDSFIPNLEDDQFPLLLNEAKALAWAELKQTSHQIAERNLRRGWTHVQTKKNAVDYPLSGFNRLPYFGRK